MTDAMNVMLTRRSVKSYRSDPVPRDLLEQIAFAGAHAPSGMGKQSPIIVAVTERSVRDKLSALNAAVMNSADTDPFYNAPAVLVVLADRSVPTYLYDGSLVMGNMLNAAHALGLGACWIHRAKQVFDSPEGKQLLQAWGISGDYEGIGNCVIGYPAGPTRCVPPVKDSYITWVE